MTINSTLGPNGYEVSIPAPVSGAWNARVTNLPALTRWRAAFAAAMAEYGIARVNCFGDSITLGARSDDTTAIPTDDTLDAQGYVGRLRTMLARKTGSTASGYMPANDKRNTLSGTGAATSGVGPVINTVRVADTTTLGGTLPLPTAATISFPVPACTTIEIAYCDSKSSTVDGGIGANTGTFSYAVDGGGATTTTADNVHPIGYKRITITGLSNAAHTLLLTGVSGTCYIVGIFYYGASGVVVSRLGLSGATCLDLTGEGTVTHLSAGSVQRIFGCLSAASASPLTTGTITGAIVSGSAVVTGISSTAGIVKGMPVGAAASLPLPCFVASVDSATQVTLTAAATGTNAARTMFFGAGATFAADLWVIPIGHNDWQKQGDTYATPVPVFKAQLQRVIDTLVAGGGCVLLVGEPKSNTAAPVSEVYTVENYWTALNELAAANDHVAAVQINSAWGTFEQGTALGLQSTAGGVHPIKKGCADMARLLFEVIAEPQVAEA